MKGKSAMSTPAAITRAATMILASLAAIPTAQAHAFLNSAQPRVGSVVAASPPQIVLTFTQAIEPDFSRIEVQDSAGASVTTALAHIAGAPSRFAVPVRPLATGAYTVIWHVTSVDTHKTQGKFHFTVSAPTGTPAR